jgi:hypothetical protein
MDLHQKLKAVIVKANKLVEQNRKLVTKNEALEQEVKAMKQTLQSEVKKGEELNNQIKIIKLARNIGSSGSENVEVAELKRKINEYIKEIDQCITMLND